MSRPVFGRANERRLTVRRPGASRGILAFNRGAAAVECSIRDFSSAGARVQAQRKVSAPDTVYLLFPDRNCAYEASVPWQSEMSLGLKFSRMIDLARELPFELSFLKWVAADHRKTA